MVTQQMINTFLYKLPHFFQIVYIKQYNTGIYSLCYMLLSCRLEQELTHIFLKKVFFILWALYSIATVSCCSINSRGQYLNELAWLCPNKIVFMSTKIWISCSYHVSWNTILLIFFNHSNTWQPILAHKIYKSRRRQMGCGHGLQFAKLLSRVKKKITYQIKSYFFRVKYHSAIQPSKQRKHFF